MYTLILLILSTLLPLITAQAQADGLIVPFTSGLPACASTCGKLFDVQGACTPPALAQTSDSCFCSDSRLTPFTSDGTAGVTSVCTGSTCSSAQDLQAIKSWYESFCKAATTTTATTSAATSTSTKSGSSGSGSSSSNGTLHQTWWDGHWKWIVMVIVIALAMITIWVGASMLRKRYIRKKEREIEMRPPVAWGPHQMQHSTGGFGDANAGARAKEAKSMAAAAPAAPAMKGGKKSWLSKNKS